MKRSKFISFWNLIFLLAIENVFSQDLKSVLTVDNVIPSYKEKKDKAKKIEVIDHKYFKLGYSEKHEQPQWVAYLLTKKMVLENNSVRSNKFKADNMVSTCSASPNDYKNSGYDKGHICPCADMSFSQKAQNLTFLMSNMSPQLHSFNAGKWEQLEEKTRFWAEENDSIIVIAGPVFDSIIERIGKNNVSVPYRFYKIIIDISYPTYKAIGFVMENKKLDKDIFYYSMSVDEVEKLTGLNLFPDYDNNVLVQNIENNRKDWNLNHSTIGKNKKVLIKNGKGNKKTKK